MGEGGGEEQGREPEVSFDFFRSQVRAGQPGFNEPVSQGGRADARNSRPVASFHLPVDCVVTRWSQWSSCSVTCGVGFVASSRTIEVSQSARDPFADVTNDIDNYITNNMTT